MAQALRPVAVAVAVVVLVATMLSQARGFQGDDAFDDPITYGSVLKLRNAENKALLHSHGVSWGSGSAQQAITTQVYDERHQATFWLLKEAHGTANDSAVRIGSPVHCGDVVRLQHLNTRKNLHSHLFLSPLAQHQEVSAFGEIATGEGDTGDNWVVVCSPRRARFWERKDPIYLEHQDTGRFLYTAKAHEFTEANCGQQCPIMNHYEVSCAPTKKGLKTKWTVEEGVFFAVHSSLQKANDAEMADAEDEGDEEETV